MQMSRLNPDWQRARLHGVSTFPGIINPSNSKEPNEFCPCCLNTIDKEKAPLCENSKQLQFLGFGFPLFYVFIKYCIILLMVTICSYNALELFWALDQNNVTCKDGEIHCTSFMIYISRINSHLDNAEVLVRIFSFVVHLGVLLYIRDLISKTRNYYDQRTCSLSDYSIIVTNLPPKIGMRAKLKKLLQNSMGKSYMTHQITFLPEYEDFYRMEEEISEILNAIKKLMREEESEKNLRKLEELNQELMNKEKYLEKYCERELELEEKDECIAEKVIFSCSTQDEKEEVLQKFKELQEDKIREAFEIKEDEECNIEFEEAPEPKEINWEHINYPDHHRLGRQVIGWLLTSLFLAAITVIFFFVLSEKSKLIEESFAAAEARLLAASSSSSSHDSSQDHSDHSQYQAAIFLVYLALICVIFFNKFVMGTVLHKICDFERHPTTAEEQFHFALKYSVGMFFTTALMTLAVQDIRFHNFYQHPYGVIQEESVMFFMNGLFVPFIWLINPWQIHVLIKRKWNEGRKDLTQKQANKIMENVQYNMGKRYAEIIEIMWFTFLYSSLIPFGAFLSAIGLALYYWVDKYNLLRRSSVNSNIAGELSLFSMKLLDFTLLCKPLGEIIFDTQIRTTYAVSSVVMCAIAIIYLILPLDSILEFFHPEKFKTEEKTYQQVQSHFKETYQTLHPIFSLKEENQKKIKNAFSIITKLVNHTFQASPLEVESVQDQNSANHLVLPLKDTSNIMQAIFGKNNRVTDENLDKA